MKLPDFFDGQDPILYQDELYQSLQENLSDNGWQTPQQSTANINNISSSMKDGTIWYDTDTNELKVKKNGVVKVILTT